ncbi:site-specific DNA-methyltransferase [Pontibacter sp. FD36]|uniref:site-specific DNA-methyltransferase n=1 Tax=Pontibacter sp. FD36 TaxID=2789860 RepID=UPI0018ABAEA6|nr:site-specific DNA-methyltransferase [Pontibacter sp. FD36]MBF8963005.1 site-specific DNA-methyltransferase [Pontibacter sp. FD36]
MPTLNWIGKDKVVNHHKEVPFRVLEPQYTFTNGEVTTGGGSENKIIHGDNLEALKALLPEYEGKVNCIYIDPPYNTGNEGWVYNDNVNHPKIKKWLGEVVGKEGEDLSRHDKWLCMMYPRLKLLHKLLADDGVIFVSIDNYEYNYLSIVLEEIFGRQNLIETLIWKKSYGGGAKSKHVVNLHEYIFFYAKDITKISKLELPPDDSILKYYKFKDEKYDTRGPFRLQPLATTSMDERPNLRYPILYEGEEIMPEKQWQWSKERVYTALNNNDLVIEKKKGKWSVNYKQYLNNEDGEQRGRKLFSIIDGFYTQHGTNEIKRLFGDGKAFNFPKPPKLVEELLRLATDKHSLVLDSFAGSGTTAQATLNLNSSDDGNRKFILVEMEEYADKITAERIRKVINEDKSGDFTFYTLGEPLFNADNELNENVPLQRIQEYIYYTETGEFLKHASVSDCHYLDTHNGISYYFYYSKDEMTTLDLDFLGTITTKADQYVIYADNCLLSPEFMAKHSIIFKKIPRDITRF